MLKRQSHFFDVGRQPVIQHHHLLPLATPCVEELLVLRSGCVQIEAGGHVGADTERARANAVETYPSQHMTSAWAQTKHLATALLTEKPAFITWDNR